jgi:hypothetical protein
MIDVSKLKHIQAAIVLIVERQEPIRGCDICRELSGNKYNIYREIYNSCYAEPKSSLALVFLFDLNPTAFSRF